MNRIVWMLALAQLSPDALSDRARELASAGKAEQAEVLWRQAVEAAPAHFASLFNLGFLSLQRRKEAEAAEWLSRAARVNPKDFNTHYLLGTAFARQDKTDDALRAWREALALQPGNRKLMQAMCVEYGKGRYFEEAARLAELAIRGAPEDASLYFLAMQARQDAGQHEEAFRWARRALEKFPGSARANFEVGFHLHKSGRWDEAMPYFEKAMAADPGYEEPYYFRGDVFLRRDKAAQAEAQFRSALERRASYTAARLGLARALIAQAKLGSAVVELEEAARQDPGNPQPHLLLAQTYFRLGKLEAAKAAKETSQRLREANPATLNAPQTRPFPAK